MEEGLILYKGSVLKLAGLGEKTVICISDMSEYYDGYEYSSPEDSGDDGVAEDSGDEGHPTCGQCGRTFHRGNSWRDNQHALQQHMKVCRVHCTLHFTKFTPVHCSPTTSPPSAPTAAGCSTEA